MRRRPPEPPPLALPAGLCPACRGTRYQLHVRAGGVRGRDASTHDRCPVCAGTGRQSDTTEK